MTPRGLLLLAAFWAACGCAGSGADLEHPCGRLPATPVERREVYYCLIDSRIDVDVACRGLEKDGDESSVPYLIAALRLFPPIPVRASPVVGLTPTTKACLAALRAVTGHDAGVWPDDWARWWTSRSAH